MRKGHSIVGLKVIASDNGADLGTVRDLIFDHDADQCAALLLDEGGFFSSAEVVGWEEIKALGPDAVMVRSSSSSVSADDAPRLKKLMDRETVLSGTRIYTKTGEDLGTFGDVYVDETSGRVMGYELSGGFVSDTMSGKRYLAAQSAVQVGEDVVLMPASSAARLEDQAKNHPGGLKGIANTAGDKIGSAYDTTKAKATEVYDNVANASIEKQKEFVTGKTAGNDVFVKTPSSEEKVLLVRKGEKISGLHAETADARGNLSQLVLAAGGGAISEATETGKDKLSHAASAASDKLAEAGASLERSAEDAAIGQPAGREVFLPSGSTLVAPGQIISRAMFEQAQGHGKRAELIAAAGLGTASQGADSAAATVQKKADGLWETIKDKSAQLTGAAEDKIDELGDANTRRKIGNALGRPVTKVILAKDDSIILNTGNIITHASIEQARDEGMLDTLLDSVSSSDPSITPEMMRADTRGEAALPAHGANTAEKG